MNVLSNLPDHRSHECFSLDRPRLTLFYCKMQIHFKFGTWLIDQWNQTRVKYFLMHSICLDQAENTISNTSLVARAILILSCVGSPWSPSDLTTCLLYLGHHFGCLLNCYWYLGVHLHLITLTQRHLDRQRAQDKISWQIHCSIHCKQFFGYLLQGFAFLRVPYYGR